MIKNDEPALVLAPMEGVTDAPMREFLGARGGFSFCVTEFFRISQDVPATKKIVAHIPELANGGCRTRTGVPVQVQLLGGDPVKLAEAARRACKAGALGIDLNFGCPAPTVNRNDGGATLLKYPARIRAIVEAVRAAVPKELPVSAKLRLGWDSIDDIDHNADMAAQGGASWLTIHGRTKAQGYVPPAYWKPIGRVKKTLGLPVVANGEIWTLDDFFRCRDETASEHFMIGRSALADPMLPLQIAEQLKLPVPSTLPPSDWHSIFSSFNAICLRYNTGHGYRIRRIKQWLTMINRKAPAPWTDELKRCETLDELFDRVRALE